MIRPVFASSVVAFATTLLIATAPAAGEPAPPCKVASAPGASIGMAFPLPQGQWITTYDLQANTLVVEVGGSQMLDPSTTGANVYDRYPGVTVTGAPGPAQPQCTQSFKSVTMKLILTNATADDAKTKAMREVMLACARGGGEGWQAVRSLSAGGRENKRPFTIFTQEAPATALGDLAMITVDVRSPALGSLTCM